MKRFIFNLLRIQLAIFILCCPGAFAQQTVKFISESSTMQIKGTSNLHDWEENVQKFNVDLEFSYDKNEIKGFNRVIFSCKSASLISDNSIMNNKTRDALKVEKYPEIKFIMTGVDKFQKNGNTLSGSISGNLTLSGVVKKISLPFTGIIGSNTITLKGTKQLNMADFRIDPPTAMFGTLKTGEIVELVYILQFTTN